MPNKPFSTVDFVWLIIGHIIMQKICIKGVFNKITDVQAKLDQTMPVGKFSFKGIGPK